jgi:hypothetical protein
MTLDTPSGIGGEAAGHRFGQIADSAQADTSFNPLRVLT